MPHGLSVRHFLLSNDFSEPEVQFFQVYFFVFLFFGQFGRTVHLIGQYIDCLNGANRADRLAPSAPDTQFFIHPWDSQTVLIGLHSDGLNRTMLRASSARGMVILDDTEIQVQFSHTDLYLFLFAFRDFPDRSIGTNFRANRTCVIAKSFLIET